MTRAEKIKEQIDNSSGLTQWREFYDFVRPEDLVKMSEILAGFPSPYDDFIDSGWFVIDPAVDFYTIKIHNQHGEICIIMQWDTQAHSKVPIENKLE